MLSEKPNYMLSKGTVLNPKTDQEVAAAMADHIYFLNSWLGSRLNYLAITLEIAAEEALENNNSECQKLIASISHQLRVTEKLVIPLATFPNPDGSHSAELPVQIATAMAQTRADWVDFMEAATAKAYA